MAELARVSHVFFELPTSGRLGRVTHAALTLPAVTELARVTHAALALPAVAELARVTHALFELPAPTDQPSGRPFRRWRSRLRIKHLAHAAPSTRRRIVEHLDTALRGLLASPLSSDRDLARELLSALPPPDVWLAQFTLIVEHWSLIVVALDYYDDLMARRRDEEAILVLMLAT